MTYRIQFAHNSSFVDTVRAENASAFSRFAQDLDSLRRTSGDVKILEIAASGCASWEGSYANNLRLCDKRARKVINHLKSTTGVDVLLKKPSPFVSEFMEIILECTSEYRDTVLTILGNSDPEEHKFTALKAIDDGRCWKWLDTEMFPRQRRVDVTVTYLAPKPQVVVAVAPSGALLFPGSVKNTEAVAAVSAPEETVTAVPPPEETVTAVSGITAVAAAPAIVDTTVDTTVVAAAPAAFAPEEKAVAADTTGRFFIAIKNNILYDAALVANLGVEIGFAKHFSLDIPVTYSPYTVSRNYRMRTLSIQPDLRYYLKEGWSGHFFGIHGNFAYYNVVTPFNTKTRYQDRDGKHPLYGAGISYGYSLPFKKDSQWGVEFTIGAGYAYLDYDCFYNVDNGAWFNKNTKHYFGLDKAGVTIYYRILDKNRKKK